MTPATEVGYVEMRIAKAVGLAADDELFDYVVLEEVAGDRQFAISIGDAEAFSLAARLGGIEWRRPMTYQFVAALVQALGRRVLKVRIDRVVEETYIATVEVEGPLGVQPGRRTTQRRAQPCGAGAGTDPRRSRSPGGSGGETNG